MGSRAEAANIAVYFRDLSNYYNIITPRHKKPQMKITDVPCPKCNGPTNVISGFSKPTDRGIRRKRICACGYTFFTYQRKGASEVLGRPEDEKTRPVHSEKKHTARIEQEQEMSISERRRQLINLAILNSRFEGFREGEGFDEIVLREAGKIRAMKAGTR